MTAMSKMGSVTTGMKTKKKTKKKKTNLTLLLEMHKILHRGGILALHVPCLLISCKAFLCTSVPSSKLSIFGIIIQELVSGESGTVARFLPM